LARLAALVLLAMLAAACSMVPGAGGAAKPRRVLGAARQAEGSAQLHPQRRARRAPLREQEGYYKEENLEVEIVAGGSGIDPIQVVAAGGADIGVSASSNLINARSQSVR